MDITRYRVPTDKLRWQCDPSLFDFDCTSELTPLGEFIGQDRAVRAVEFGLAMNRDGYNIYVAGLTGTGKTSVVKSYIKKLIERRQKEQPYHPEDWCYIYSFADPDRPQSLNLPQGKGKVWRDQISNLLQRLKEEMAKAFSSEEYKAEQKKTTEESHSEQQKLFQEIGDAAQRQGFVLEITAIGPALIPMLNGKPMSQADYLALEEPVRKELETKRNDLLKRLQSVIERAREIDREIAEKLHNTDKAVADFTVSRLFDSLLVEYQDSTKITRYLTDLKTYTLDSLDVFKETEETAHPGADMTPATFMPVRDPFLPFHVNIFVDNSATVGPPVITETNPNYPNLFGKIERRFLLGGYLSDHTMLKPGSLQLANGGYLLLSANDVLTNPGVWPALKRSIKTKEVSIEDPFEQFGLIAPQGLRPQPMPVDVKIILIGDSMLYQLLSLHDEDFWEIFKVKADFNFEVDRSKDNMMALASFIAGCCQECNLRHFDRTGVARVIEYASRMVADQEKMSSRFAQIKELIEEAEYWASQNGGLLVLAEHVEKAVQERRFRHNLPDERIKEMITRGTIMIDVAGSVVGQVNGLSVYSLGDITFGKPARITCQTFLGRGGLINIERESQLSGRIHDKGVLILSGYMGWKYAQDNPLSLSASLCFEQSYEGIDGDSASSTELYALLSSLSGIPIKQNIAVTGSVNQKGEIQPIGGVNQKIEGFFQICQARGLTGDQGVMIPRTNLRNLMLCQEAVDAVSEGKFHIYAVGTIDEGIEVLSGVAAGEKKKDGTYPEGTINYLVDKRLKEMATKLRHFSVASADGEKEGKLVLKRDGAGQ
ncbi:MAG: peptidase lon-like protein [Dehalococcoidales bacterium]|nr:peptidase lon-like protein [Dehalococcoidales bacterium]